jgi:glycosyltransferase involved in cell wall biosynthesis
MRVGHLSPNYLYVRCIVDIVHDVDYVRIADPSMALSGIGRRINSVARRQLLPTNDLHHRFNDHGINRVDLIHFYNTISYGRTPWITSFETVVPRFSATLACHHGPNPGFSCLFRLPRIQKALRAMSSSSCRFILAGSDCSARMQEELLSHFPEVHESIARKMRVLHPPQTLVVSRYADKPVNLDGEVIFMLVGASFWRKGGIEILETLGHLRTTFGYPIRLIIVSSLRIHDYARPSDHRDADSARRLIRDNSEWVEYYPQLPNDRVLDLMKRCHVGLLPSYAETYGFSVLEFQAAGCPVITTDVRALPETNGPDRGWLIEVPKNRLGEALYTSRRERTALSAAIRAGLARSVQELMIDRSVLVRKGEASIAHIARSHSVEGYSRRMWATYLEALERPQ